MSELVSSHVIDDGAYWLNHFAQSWVRAHFIAELACLVSALLGRDRIEIDLHALLVLHLGSVWDALTGKSAHVVRRHCLTSASLT
jgi:methyl coenzyme M reductase subunit C